LPVRLRMQWLALARWHRQTSFCVHIDMLYSAKHGSLSTQFWLLNPQKTKKFHLFPLINTIGL
jgi:hypothetical protein